MGCQSFVQRPHVHPPLESQALEELSRPPAESPKPSGRQNFRRTEASAPTVPLLTPAYKKIVSLEISSQTPLFSVLQELGTLGLSLSIDPSITGGVNFKACDTPLSEILQALVDLGGLRYNVLGKTLRLERDSPYTQTYDVQFLNLVRKSENAISTSTDVFANTQSRTLGDNGSSSSITVSGQNNFWEELDQSLKFIVQENGTYALHRQAGVLSMSGGQKIHRTIHNYLKRLRESMRRQVLIEAKIVEVSLYDAFRSGINWQKITSQGDWKIDARMGEIARGGKFSDPTLGQNLVTLGVQGSNFASLLEALQEFGSSRTLSSPRLTVMNNQSSLLKVAQNQVYFRLNYDKQFLSNVQRDSISISSDIQTVPIGLVMSVQASIDEETGEIVLFLRPTISRLSQSIRDPAVDIALNTTNPGDLPATRPSSYVPIVEVREIDSIMRLTSGEIAVMGGLMELRSQQDIAKVPLIGDVPLGKELFQGRSEGDQVVELVILIKATILDGNPVMPAADERLLTYTHDPRPF